MPTVSASVWIDAPRERVWRLVSDPSRYPEWVDDVQEIVYTSDGAMREDWVYRERVKRGGKLVSRDWRIVTWDPPRLQVHRGSMPDMDAEVRITLEPDRDGTLWFHEMEYRLMPRFRPMGWLLEKLLVQRQMQATFARVLAAGKRLVEAPVESPPPGATAGRARPS